MHLKIFRHLDFSSEIAIFVLSCKEIRRPRRRNGQAGARPCRMTVGDAGTEAEKPSQFVDIHRAYIRAEAPLSAQSNFQKDGFFESILFYFYIRLTNKRIKRSPYSFPGSAISVFLLCKIPSERANLIFFQHKFTSETPSYLHYDKTIPTKNNTILRKTRILQIYFNPQIAPQTGHITQISSHRTSRSSSAVANKDFNRRRAGSPSIR